MDQLNIGIVGTGGRGKSFKPVIERRDDVHVRAVCDVDPDALSQGSRLHSAEGYRDYENMLEETAIDAVIIGTPVEFHVPQSIAALDRGLHVLCEVPGATSIDECRELVDACKRSNGGYTMTENFPFLRSNMIVSRMVADGLFGEVYYAEGEYLHELKALNEHTPWRRRWQTGINGITYPTHSLGPILEWMDDRISRLTCAGSGHHYSDPRGAQYELEDTTVMLAETGAGSLLKVRLDMLSERPDGIDNYQLQGTKGCYESARTEQETHQVWLDEFEDPNNSRTRDWRDLSTLQGEYLPEVWEEVPEDLGVTDEGSEGLAFRPRVMAADFVMLNRIFDSILTDSNPPIDIHDAMDLTLPGLISQRSIQNGGEWMAVPDSRDW